ncbi:MAG TPA: TetR/AcrR family transcriptional regulator C-terminal domain-containing protein [Friedmanniella sp.]
MAIRGRSGCPTPGERWEAQVTALSGPGAKRQPAREPLSVERIVDAALQLVQLEGFDALTMRRLAAMLQATPGALYPHVQDKQNLDDLMLGAICARVQIPAPEPASWQAQAIGVCEQLRDEYLRYPGIWRATLAAAPSTPDTMRIMEGLLAILSRGGVPLRYGAWAIDAALQYTGAYSVTAPRRSQTGSDPGAVLTRDEITARLAMLPPDQFPITAAHAAELTSGEGHERFAYALGLLFGGLPHQLAVDEEHEVGPVAGDA